VLLLLSVVCAGLAAAWIDASRRVDRPAALTLSAQLKTAHRVVHDAEQPPLPQLELDRLAPRAARTQAGDLFESRGWMPRERPTQPPLQPVAQPGEQLPPLPFTYMGKWTERDQVVVLLASEGRNYIAHVDEVLDGTYRIDSIEASHLVMTYLPLGLRQTLDFDRTLAANPAPGARVRIAALPVGAQNADAALRVVVPAQASIAEEFVLMLRLDPRDAASLVRGSVEVVYDPKILTVTVAGATRKGARASSPDPGHIAVELGGAHVGDSAATTAVRMRVVADAPTTTQIALATPVASDAKGANLVVAVDGPNPRTLTIVPSPNAIGGNRTEQRQPH
jgi:hypothetical protein